MRNKIKGFVCTTLFLMLMNQTAFALGTSDAYYMAYDEFKIFNNTKTVTSTVSSYDSSELGGAVYLNTVSDDSDYAGTITKRDLNKVEGVAKWQVGFYADTACNGATINLQSGGTNIITLEKMDGDMWVLTPKGRIKLPGDEGYYGIESVIDVDANTFSIQANGKTVGNKLKFLNTAEFIDRFWIEMPKEGTGSFSLTHMRIHKNYTLNEWFMGTHKEVPDDWTVIGKGSSISSKLASDGHDKYSLYIEDGSFVAESGIAKDVTYDSDELWLEYVFYVPKKVGDFGATLSADGKDIIKIGVDGLDYGYWTDDKFKSLYTIKSELWNHAMIKLKKDGAEVYINHKLLADKIPVENVKIDNIRFTVGKVATGAAYIDEIMAKPIYPLPDDYVPEPVVPVKANDAIVGIQSCNLWREGTHLGWDCLTAYDDRTTYLGYYDEGSTEVADWETKWLVEHGVDFELFCWYRQSHTTNTPIQRSLYSYGLHDGYMNSEYSNYLKFAIAWENGSGGYCDGTEDFRKNIVPYWMEHYFKDDRYMLIDNKPILAIYQISALKRDFGSVEGVKEALDYLDEACKKEGFDGVYVLIQSVARNETTLNEIKATGADAVYAYNWGPNQADIEIQKNGMMEQSAFGIMDVVPIVAMGYDDIPWERTGGSYADVEKVEELASWVVNEFQPTQKGLGNKIVLLDNWNEIAEGHFYYPSNLQGFGYLDAIRNVFTTGGEHNDLKPEDEAKKRYNHIFVQEREVPQTFYAMTVKRRQELGIDADDEFKVLKKYDFDDGDSPDNYPIAKQIENVRIENGSMFATSTDVDPGFYIQNINLPTSNIRRFKVRLKTDVSSSRFQIYYLTDNDGNWDESKTVYTDYSQGDGYIELSFDPTNGSKWYGDLTEFRIDPMSTKGNFELESIEITGYGLDEVQPLSIDGAQQYPQRKIFYEDGIMYAPAAEFASTLGYRWQKSFDNNHLEMMNEETGAYHSFVIGKDAKVNDGELYFPLRMIAEEAGFKVVWDSARGCANIVTKSESDENLIPDPEGTLNFNTAGDLCGLTSFSNMGNTKVLNGAFSFSAVSNDPNMYLYPKMNANNFPYCNIRIRNKSQGDSFQVYFSTVSSTGIEEKKSVTVKISKDDKDYKCYAINMASNTFWNGELNSIRFDPTNGSGAVSIDYIIFSDKPITDSNFGEESVDGVNILVGGTMDKKELAYVNENVTAGYTDNEQYLGKYSLKLHAASDSGLVKFPAGITKGNKYSVTLWVKSPDVSGIKIGAYDASGVITNTESRIDGIGNSWAKVTVRLPENMDDASGIYLSQTKGTVYLDQLHLWESSEKEDVEPVYTPDFKERTTAKRGPKKVLILGNSITLHEYSDSIGWHGNWGMAATSKDKDYVHLLEKLAIEKDSKVEFMVKNIWDFERYFYDFGYINSNNYKDAVDFDADIIICAYGANINNAANENDDSFLSGRTFTEIDYQKIANYFNPYGDAKIIIGVTPLVLAEIRGEMVEAADETGWAFVDMSDLTDEKYKAYPYKDAPVFGDNVTGGVLGHPGDLGMEVMAERLWVELEKAMDSIER